MQSSISEYRVSAAATQGRDRGASSEIPVRRILVDAPGLGVLLDQRTAYPGVGAPVVMAPHQHIAVDVMSCELVCGQIDPASFQVLVDVAQEVGELEGFSECGGVWSGFLTRADGAQHGQQLQSDHFGGPYM